MITDNDREIMLIAQEECAEVTQAISKIFRFGFDSFHNQRDNRSRLEEEVGDLMCMIDLMREADLINWNNVIDASEKKREKLRKWSKIGRAHV